MNIQRAFEALDDLRASLGALELQATFETGHGDVHLVVRDGQHHVDVNGRPVPRREPTGSTQ
jgi:hypothetical protein